MSRTTKAEFGDILYSKVGCTYGIPVIVDTKKLFGLYVSVCLIKPIHEVVNNLYLLHTLASSYVLNQARKRIKGIGVPDLHLKEIRDFNILIPPLNLQQIFASQIETLELRRQNMEASLAQMEELKSSLIQEYFG